MAILYYYVSVFLPCNVYMQIDSEFSWQKSIQLPMKLSLSLFAYDISYVASVWMRRYGLLVWQLTLYETSFKDSRQFQNPNMTIATAPRNSEHATELRTLNQLVNYGFLAFLFLFQTLLIDLTKMITLNDMSYFEC